MALTIIKTPQRTVHNLSTDVIAAKSQVYYEGERNDLSFNKGGSLGGYRVFSILAGDYTSQFQEGMKVYVKFDDGSWEGEAVCWQDAAYGGVDTTVYATVPILPTNPSGDGTVNTLSYYPNYYLDVVVSDEDDGTEISNFKFVPAPNGSFKIDLKSVVLPYMINKSYEAREINVNIEEIWDGGTGDSLLNDPVQCVIGQKSLLSIGGAAMWEHLLRSSDYTISEFNELIEIGGGLMAAIVDDTTGFAVGDIISVNDSTGDGAYIDQVGYITLIPSATEIRTTIPVTYRGDSQNGGTLEIVPARFLSRYKSHQPRTYNVLGELYTISTAFDTGGNVTLRINTTINDIEVGDNLICDFNSVYPDGIYEVLAKSGRDITIDLAWISQVFDHDVQSIKVVHGLFKDDVNPILWKEWIRTLSYLVDVDLGTRVDYTADTLYERRGTEDASKQEISSADVSKTTTEQPTIVHATVNTSPVTDPFASLVLRDAANAENISEQMFFEVRDSCKNPVMIEWQNSLGGFDQHLFSIKQEVNLVSKEGLSYEQGLQGDFEDTAGAKYRKNELPHQQFRLMAEQLRKEHLMALAEIKNSDIVRLWLNKTGDKYLDVLVIEQLNTPFNSDEAYHKFSLVVELPDGADFYQVKEY